MRKWSYISILLVVGAFACRQRTPYSKPDSSPEGRKIIGVAPDYPATALDTTILNRSMRDRRDAAWKTVAKVLAASPLALGDQLNATDAPRSLALWQTWYQSDEFKAVFRELYHDLTPAERASKASITSTAVARKLAWLANRDAQDFAWTPERFTRRLLNVVTPEDVKGIAGTDGMSGRGMTFFSPALIDHLATNYNAILGCKAKVATLSPDKDFGDGAAFTPCFRSEFPSNAVAIKTAWLPAATPMLHFDTSAASLKQQLESGEWKPTTPISGASTLQPTPNEIYTMRARPSVSDTGPSFRMAGMHIVTKEARHWTWISLWWSDSPDTDFGADRPTSINQLGPAWGHYKMCVVTDFSEGDQAPWADYEADHPTLAVALKTAAQSPSTWCSNPYIEKGHGNARTNCIGCHQHAGTGVVSDDVFADESRFPDSGRRQLRKNFPADYLWAFDAGNDLFAPTIIGETSRQDQLDASAP